MLKLGEDLVALSAAQLAKLPIPEPVLAQVREAQRITAHGARKRQIGFLAKQLRREDDATLDALRDALIANGDATRRATLALHRVERWRDRLLAEGPAGVQTLLRDHPDADADALTRLIETARRERTEKRPPRAYRALFDLLRPLLSRHD